MYLEMLLTRGELPLYASTIIEGIIDGSKEMIVLLIFLSKLGIYLGTLSAILFSERNFFKSVRLVFDIKAKLSNDYKN